MPKASTPRPKRRGPPLTAYERREASYKRNHPDWRSDPHWRQHMRGKPTAEHVPRRERERREALETGKLTTYERGVVNRFADKQAKRAGLDPEAARAQFQALARARGYGAVIALKAEVQRMSRQKRVRFRRRVKLGKATRIIDISGEVERAQRQRAQAIEDMWELAEDYGIDFELLFYH